LCLASTSHRNPVVKPFVVALLPDLMAKLDE